MRVLILNICITIVTFFSGCDTTVVSKQSPEEFDEIKIMSFNVLYSTPLESSVSAIRASGADIIGLQEASRSRISELQQKLGFYSHSFSNTTGNLNDQDTGILSRFKIVRYLNDGVVVQVNPSLQVAVFSVHLSPYPYQPYDFRDGKISTAEEAIAGASFRLNEINPVLEQINLLKSEGIPVFLTGDFNEPSHLDWTSETVTANMHFNKVVAWPVSTAVANTEMKDAYRTNFSNAANFPGITWTTMETANEVYDRIDIIYHSTHTTIELQDIRYVAGKNDLASITVDDYASDHYAVLATYSLKK